MSQPPNSAVLDALIAATGHTPADAQLMLNTLRSSGYDVVSTTRHPLLAIAETLRMQKISRIDMIYDLPKSRAPAYGFRVYNWEEAVLDDSLTRFVVDSLVIRDAGRHTVATALVEQYTSALDKHCPEWREANFIGHMEFESDPDSPREGATLRGWSDDVKNCAFSETVNETDL